MKSFIILTCFLACTALFAQPIPYGPPPRYMIIERYYNKETLNGLVPMTVVLKVDTLTGETWILKPAGGFGQVDVWQRLNNY